jgi:hypothetical protein
LLGELLYARDFPVGEIETYAVDIAAWYPRLPQNYEVARSAAQALARGETSHDALRQAFAAYRRLFEDLLETRSATPAPRR